MATIQDVAALAGVSISSVSNMLNGRTDRLGRETYRRIEAAIRELGYRPNLVARQLKTGNTRLLGLLVPSTANPMFGELAVHIETAAKEQQDLRVLLANSHRDRKQESEIFDDLLALGVHGVILASSSTDESHLEAALARGMAVVSYDRGGDHASRIDHVSPDNLLAARLAVEHLALKGHRRLALLTPDLKTASRVRKREGFLAAAQAAGIGATAHIVEAIAGTGHGDSNLADAGYASAARIAAMPARQRPTGIITINDMMALGLMAGLHHAGLSVPHDISVIGMDNLVVTAYANPPLTSVAMPSREMAATMVRMVAERLADPTLPGREILFTPTLIERGSVAPPPATTAARTASSRKHAT